jgi:hypothetical protein
VPLNCACKYKHGLNEVFFSDNVKDIVHNILAYFEIKMCHILKQSRHKASCVNANLSTAQGVRYHVFEFAEMGKLITLSD